VRGIKLQENEQKIYILFSFQHLISSQMDTIK